jgi:lipoprotein-anchoring transpeptidase ErfK/SrfK
MGHAEGGLAAKRVMGWLILGLLTVVPAAAQSAGTEASAAELPAGRQVLVSLQDRQLAVLEQGKVLRTFRVSVGARVSPSPIGEFRIVNRLARPTYYHPGVVIPPGKDSPIGPRWLGLSKKGYGIHGTNEPWSIGRAESHGCIRLRNRDIKQLFELVHVGDTVEIRGQRDEQTAEIFGGAVEAEAVAAVIDHSAGASGQ